MQHRKIRFFISLGTVFVLLLSSVEIRAQLLAGPNVNASRLRANQTEAAIAINPTNPNNLFVFSNTELTTEPPDGLFAAFSLDGGATWTYVDPTDGVIADGNVGDPLPPACCDPSAAFDDFGNLFIAYLDSNFITGPQIRVALSTNGGQSFTLLATLGINTDQETIVTGPGSVWITYKESGIAGTPIVAHGAAVTGLGQVAAFGPAQAAPGSAAGTFGDIAIGPNGQVLVTYQDDIATEGPSTIFVNLDPDGLGPAGFGPATVATTTNVGVFDFISPQPDRSVDAEAGLAWDRSGGPFNGRVYLVYTDEIPNESDDTDIFVRFSDNNGASWSAPVRANDDSTTRSQFLPRIALDQTTGDIAVSWHDSRNDDGLGGPGDTDGIPNTNAQVFATVSRNGGVTFLPNVQVSAGTSDENGAEPPALCCVDIDYGDYTGLAFFDGNFYVAWADNSNSSGDNPDGTLSTMELYTAKVSVSALAVVNALVSFESLTSTFSTTSSTTGCPSGFAGKFNFQARLTDQSSSPPLSGLLTRVTTLTNGNLLQNADGGPAGVGAMLTVPKTGDFSDGVLSPGEFVDVPFSICLKNIEPFSFFVDVFGTEARNISNSLVLR